MQRANLLKSLDRSWRDARYIFDSAAFVNPLSALRHRVGAPDIGGHAARLVGELDRCGAATTTFAQLFGAEAWDVMRAFGADFARSPAVRAVNGQVADDYDERRVKKNHVVSLSDEHRFPGDHPLVLAGLSPALLEVVNGYLGLWSKLSAFNAWYVLPNRAGHSRTTSQRWHRDPEDRRMLKVFLYLSDVDAEAGPFEYIPESRRGGKHADIWHETSGSGGYGSPPQEVIAERIPPQDRLTLTGPAGTVVFCDTSGLHRGGYARSKARVSAYWMFLTPASPRAARYRFSSPVPASALAHPAARYAIVLSRRRALLLPQLFRPPVQ